jgi:hypothetical protein
VYTYVYSYVLEYPPEYWLEYCNIAAAAARLAGGSRTRTILKFVWRTSQQPTMADRLVAIVVAATTLGAADASSSGKPHVIMIVADGARAAVSCASAAPPACPTINICKHNARCNGVTSDSFPVCMVRA